VSGDLTLPLVLGAAAVDSINPCAIGVILFLSSVLLRVSDEKRTLLVLGGVYIATVYVVYMLSGLGLVWFQSALISRGYAEIVGIVVGVLVIGFGLFELKNFFWYGKGMSPEMSSGSKGRLTAMAQNVSVLGVRGSAGSSPLSNFRAPAAHTWRSRPFWLNPSN
jgi:cytochrome c biogenesis protein CcdA